MGMKVRFHGQVEWHVQRSTEGEAAPSTLCGISLENANTFSYTFRKVAPDEMCPRCGALDDSDDTDPRVSMDRG